MTTTATAHALADRDTSERRRWPLRPLLDAAGVTLAGLALELGTTHDVVTAVGRRGLSDAQADEWAIRVGFHPLLVWGWAWVDAANAPDAQHQRIALELRDRIETGDPAPGDPLPTTKALAQRWGVTPTTVSKATAELDDDGLVTAGGRGLRPVVADPTDLGCLVCDECGEPIDPGAEHFPHRPGCTRPVAGWCDCDRPTHPGCCPTCREARP